MSYPQPNADEYAINGYQYFRLNTLLASPGDVYESAQSALAFALGPESDISRVSLAYFDDQLALTRMNSTKIDQNRSFAGRIDARNEVPYLPSGRPGKILLWSDDLYDPTYVPSASVGYTPGDAIQRVAPRLDVFQFFQQPATLVPRRADKEYYFQSYVLGATPTWVIVPTYGRKYGFVEITNRDPLITTTFRVIGVNYGIGSAFHQEKMLSSGPLAPGAQITVNNFLGQSGFGMFDAVVFVAEGDRMPMRVYLSDEP